jgi:DNA replication regulator DPB11
MLDLRLSHEPSTNSAATSFARPVTKPRGPFVDEDEDEDKDDEDEPPIAPYDGPASLPLQDINPSVNSPRRPSTSSDASGTKLKPNTKSASTTRSNSTSDASLKPAPAPHIARPVKEPTPDSVIPPSTAPLKQEEKPKPPEVDHTGIMSNILAQRKAAAAAASLNNAEKEKKKRLLGRASSIRSNPSTGEATFSRTSSIVEEGDGEGTKKEEEVYQPSQELGWDTGGLVQGIGVVKDIVTDSGARTGRRRRL